MLEYCLSSISVPQFDKCSRQNQINFFQQNKICNRICVVINHHEETFCKCKIFAEWGSLYKEAAKARNSDTNTRNILPLQTYL